MQSGHASDASVGGDSRTSDSVTIFGFARCFSQAALEQGRLDGQAKSVKDATGGRWGSRVWLGDDESSFWRDHDPPGRALGGGRVDGLEETSRDTRRSLEARSVVKLLVVVGRAVLNPVA